MANNDQVLRIGTELQNGRYIIHRVLGIGGFSITYEAEDTSFHLRVAIKEFFPNHLCNRGDDEKSVVVRNSNDDLFERHKNQFLKEAYRLAHLNNPHVVNVYDVIEENGTAYSMMDFIEGESLADLLKRTGKPLEENKVSDILEQMLEALECIHERRLFHLNIKPENIIMQEGGKVILIDFGTSRYAVNAMAERHFPVTANKSNYYPIEQYSGFLKNMGPWTDIYALGATLFHLLTGKTPSRVIEILHDGFDTTPFPNTVSLQMQQLVKWMMNPHPRNRPQSVEEIRESIQGDDVDFVIIDCDYSSASNNDSFCIEDTDETSDFDDVIIVGGFDHASECSIDDVIIGGGDDHAGECSIDDVIIIGDGDADVGEGSNYDENDIFNDYSPSTHQEPNPCPPPIPDITKKPKHDVIKNEKEGDTDKQTPMSSYPAVTPQQNNDEERLSLWKKIKKCFGGTSEKPKKVYSSVFAPAEVKKKSHMLTQVYLHLAEETEKVAKLAKESQADAVRREYIPLDCMLKKGDRVDVNINIFGSTLLMTDNKSIKWEGSYNKCSFDFFVPEDIDVDELSCRILLKVNHAMVGEMIFITKIVDSPRNLNPNIITHRFKKVFISYSHKDRDKVQYLANAFRLQQIDYFFDRDYLKGGDVFPLKIKEYIDSADLFVLCWSENAAKSEYVNRERHQALQLAYPQKELSKATLTIYPLSIEPRADLPEDMANIYNFEVI